MKKSYWLLLISVVFLFGCGLAYQSKRDELLRTAKPEDWGTPPPANHQEIEKQFVLERLKDPDSAKFKFGTEEATREILQESFASPTPILVWQTKVNVNAKNSYGGYVGFKPYLFAWKDSKIYAYFTDSGGNISFWEYVK